MSPLQIMLSGGFARGFFCNWIVHQNLWMHSAYFTCLERYFTSTSIILKAQHLCTRIKKPRIRIPTFLDSNSRTMTCPLACLMRMYNVLSSSRRRPRNVTSVASPNFRFVIAYCGIVGKGVDCVRRRRRVHRRPRDARAAPRERRGESRPRT